MAACCDPGEYDVVFTSKYARRTAKSLRESGLDDTAAKMVDFVTEQGLDGATVLEIGGGVGGLHSELLRRGASRATNVELSTAYESEAANLSDESGLTDRVNRLIVDVVTDPGAVPSADIVVLHRVVCCYPDFAALLGAAADRARQMLVFSYPRRRLLTRAGTLGENLGYAIRRRDFRVFVHSPDAMLAVLADHGHWPVSGGQNTWWQFTGTVSG
ncbi:MAG: SAM-dependent methyltransferase [Actinomycetia bacterium]|nr:SAM-dependent methyltransferase [Actinomycetes bacterium]